MLLDLTGTFIGASDATLAFVFCPKSPLCVYQNATQTWTYVPTTNVNNIGSGGGGQGLAIGPQLQSSVANYPELNTLYLRTIKSQSTGSSSITLGSKTFYVVWVPLPETSLFGGASIVQPRIHIL